MESEIKRLRAEGPARLQFLFSITSALLGSLLVLAGLKALDIELARRAAILTSFLLFSFSLVTYQYLIGRDISCDRNARATARIRRYFLERSPNLQRHISWQITDAPTQWLRVDNSGVRRMTILISSGLAGLFGGLSFFELWRNVALSYAAGFLGGVLVVGSLRQWASRRFTTALTAAMAEQRFAAEPAKAPGVPADPALDAQARSSGNSREREARLSSVP